MNDLKTYPEDFIVTEIYDLQIGPGPYNYYSLKKKNYTTEKAVQKICEALRIPRKNIGYAGNKDKCAITSQAISIYKKKADNLKLKDIALEFLGTGKERITLGDLKGNEFEIVVRNPGKLMKNSKFPNYFDEQRFSRNNVELGRLFVKKDFEGMARTLSAEYDLAKYVGKNDYVGALKSIPKKILMIYAHAYQSYLWNEALSRYLRGKGKERIVRYSHGDLVFLDEYEEFVLPLLGFGTEFENEEIESIYCILMKKEGIALRDFIVRQFPEIPLDSDVRPAIVEANNFRMLEETKEKAVVSFSLPKGSYATMFIKSILA